MSRRRGSRDPVSGALAFASRVALWGALALFGLGVIAVSCEALGRGLGEASEDARGRAGAAGDARAKVTVAAMKETTSELRAEAFAQALNARGFRIERRYGLEGWRGMSEAFERSGGAFVFPVQAGTSAPDELPVPGATMLRPAREPVGGKHPAPLVGDGWAREHPDAVGALDETTAELDAREFAGMVEAVEDGTPVVGVVVAWRKANGLPDAPGVRPVEPEEERV